MNMLFTIGASAEIAAICPNKDIARVEEIFARPYPEMIKGVAVIAAALANGYEYNQLWENPGYQVKKYAPDMILGMTMDKITALQEDIVNAIQGGMKGTVETETPKTEGTMTKE